MGYEEHTTFSGRDVVDEFPISETDISSSAAGFSLNTSLPWLASSGSSGSLRLQISILYINFGDNKLRRKYYRDRRKMSTDIYGNQKRMIFLKMQYKNMRCFSRICVKYLNI